MNPMNALTPRGIAVLALFCFLPRLSALTAVVQTGNLSYSGFGPTSGLFGIEMGSIFNIQKWNFGEPLGSVRIEVSWDAALTGNEVNPFTNPPQVINVIPFLESTTTFRVWESTNPLSNLVWSNSPGIHHRASSGVLTSLQPTQGINTPLRLPTRRLL